jgi:hypothetical protein
MNEAGPSPFSPRAVLAILVAGAIAFLLTLYFIGAGEFGNDSNSDGGHAGGKGLNGFAALTRLVESSGRTVEVSRNEGKLSAFGLMVLTPPHYADGEELAKAVDGRRSIGPTIVILPKWHAAQAPDFQKDAKRGWVIISGSGSPEWKGFADDVSVSLGKAQGWRMGDLAGQLPDRNQVQSGGGSTNLIPLVRSGDGRVLAAYFADEGHYPALNQLAGMPASFGGDSDYLHPVIFVFEPDLLDNYGMARRENALLADRLITAASNDKRLPVTFDLTLNGLGRSTNLLTLAFTPPFLAATLCLIIAGIIIAWRALRRFGPALSEGRPIALGKRQLVINSAGFIRRTGRLHLLGPPYAALLRGRIANLLGLRKQEEIGALDRQIDSRLAARGIDNPDFSQLARQLGESRNAHELLRAAQAIKLIERKLET